MNQEAVLSISVRIPITVALGLSAASMMSSSTRLSPMRDRVLIVRPTGDRGISRRHLTGFNYTKSPTTTAAKMRNSMLTRSSVERLRAPSPFSRSRLACSIKPASSSADLLFYEKTKKFITEHRKKSPEKPFFAVLSSQICHAPVLPAPQFNGATAGGPRGDFVHELDTLVGRVLDLLAELKIDEETLVLFNADNGPETMHAAWMRTDHDHDASGGRRGVKRDGWEGGHRVPFIARWPKRIPKGQVSDQMTNTTDIFATLASIVGYELPDDAATDSFDILPAMLGNQNPKKSIRPHLLTQSFRGEFQIRQGSWKYLDHQGSGGNNYARGIMKQYALPEAEPKAPGQLYNLSTDPGETTNLYSKAPEKRRQLRALLHKLKESGRSAPKGRMPIGIENIPRLK